MCVCMYIYVKEQLFTVEKGGAVARAWLSFRMLTFAQ